MKQLIAVAVLMVGCGKGSSNEPAKAAAPPVCVDGTAADCASQAHGKWTGAQCCVAGTLTCTDGNAADCASQAHGAWTGAKCCL